MEYLIEVEPTRIGQLGIGSFLIMTGGIVYLISCIVGSTIKNPWQLYAISTISYGSLIVYLASATRRSRWAVSDDVVLEVDNYWLIRMVVGIITAIGCLMGLIGVFQFDTTKMIVGKEIETNRDKCWNEDNVERFLF